MTSTANGPSPVDDFIERARGTPIDDYAIREGLVIHRRRSEHPQPCPVCGGKDRFAVNTRKGIWNCRSCGVGGDAIALAAHIHGFAIDDRAGFLQACAAVLGEPLPDANATESPEDKVKRLAQLELQRQENARRAAERERTSAQYRERERDRARGIWQGADARWQGSTAHLYLERRLGVSIERVVALRASRSQTYWHGRDDAGRPVSIYSGPAMLGAFVDKGGSVIGCHITWIDPDNPPKYRPDLGVDEKGSLPEKKMRGSKAGGLIAVFGSSSATRWIVGEGIETVLAVASLECFREDTFYCAAGDLGNMAGPAPGAGRFAHPNLKRRDKNGTLRRVMMPSPTPDVDRLTEGFPIVEHVRECILLGDGDSERVWTAAMLARAVARVRLLVPTCRVRVLWPPAGFGDFCDFIKNRGH